MSKCGEFPECGSCINREHDPFQCDDCEDASNYEPDEDSDSYEEMTYEDFKTLLFGDEYLEAA